MKLVSIGEAKAGGSPFYFTGKPCKRGHVGNRYVTGRACVACVLENTARSHSSRATERAQYHAAWRQENKGKCASATARWRANNPGAGAEVAAEWRRNNRDKLAKNQAKRRAQNMSATPPWLTQEHQDAIAALYADAKRLNEETGVEHHVDHVIPLVHPAVCGLHVPWNLQVIPANDNLKKSNKFEAA
jgi:hypothetical protein